MNTLSNFMSWLRKDCEEKEMLCHFYYQTKSKAKRKEKNYSNKVDFAYFNLFNDSKKWVIKGTTGHGTDLTCEVPVLNCYRINSEFIKALKKPVNEWKFDYEFGLILDKEKLVEGCETYLRYVMTNTKNPKYNSMDSWCKDKGWRRKGVLDPFNMCDVVRLRILRSRNLAVPIKLLDDATIRATLVKRGNKEPVRTLLDTKGWNDCKVFPLLPNFQVT